MRLASSSGWVIAAVMVTLVACGDSFSAASGDSGSSTNDGGGSLDSSTPAEGGGDDSASTLDGAVDVSAPDASSIDGSTGEGAAGDGGPASTGVACGAQMSCSGTTPVCCLGTTTPACAHQECGCDTQLACASDLDCKLTEVCCIGNVKDTACGTGHFVAGCGLACGGGQSHLCDPNAQTIQCLAGKTCSTNSNDLQSVGLPGPPYGVCQ